MHDNDEIVTNEQGGKQSKLEYAYELLDPNWLRDVAHVLYQGRLKYGAYNWQNITDYREHLGRAMYHIQQALEDKDHSEMHFANATCRLMFADWCYKNTKTSFRSAWQDTTGTTLPREPIARSWQLCICNHPAYSHLKVGEDWDTKEPIVSCEVCGCRTFTLAPSTEPSVVQGTE